MAYIKSFVRLFFLFSTVFVFIPLVFISESTACESCYNCCWGCWGCYGACNAITSVVCDSCVGWYGGITCTNTNDECSDCSIVINTACCAGGMNCEAADCTTVNDCPDPNCYECKKVCCDQIGPKCVFKGCGPYGGCMPEGSQPALPVEPSPPGATLIYIYLLVINFLVAVSLTSILLYRMYLTRHKFMKKIIVSSDYPTKKGEE